MKPGWAAAALVGFSVLLTLLAAGVVYLVSSQPRGEPIRLRPLPTAQPLVVQVSGAVSHPGVYPLAPGSRVKDAIQAAGGLLPDANTDLINQAALIQDGQLIWVPAVGTDASTPSQTAPAQSENKAERVPTRTPHFPINLNSATHDELLALPGIGEVRAQSIIDYRTAHGPFQAIEDIQSVDGIGAGIFEKIKDLITVDITPPGSAPP